MRQAPSSKIDPHCWRRYSFIRDDIRNHAVRDGSRFDYVKRFYSECSILAWNFQVRIERDFSYQLRDELPVREGAYWLPNAVKCRS